MKTTKVGICAWFLASLLSSLSNCIAITKTDGMQYAAETARAPPVLRQTDTKIRLIPLLVASEIVPMQFYKGMSFPTSQVLSFDEVGSRSGKEIWD
jgi:hypothetical protein